MLNFLVEVYIAVPKFWTSKVTHIRWGLLLAMQYFFGHFSDKPEVKANFTHFSTYGLMKNSVNECHVHSSLYIIDSQRTSGTYMGNNFFLVRSKDKYLDSGRQNTLVIFWTFLTCIGLWIGQDLRNAHVLHHYFLGIDMSKFISWCCSHAFVRLLLCLCTVTKYFIYA